MQTEVIIELENKLADLFFRCSDFLGKELVAVFWQWWDVVITRRAELEHTAEIKKAALNF